MEISRKDYIQHFSMLSDEALLDVQPGDLVPAARECLEQELAKRGLTADIEEMAEEDAPPSEPVGEEPGEEDPFVVVAEYMDPGEADLARTLLQGGGIRAMLLNEQLASQMGRTVSPGVYQMLVRESAAEAAHEILASEISEEELAAQAEAAGAEHQELLDFTRRYTEAWCSQDPAAVAEFFEPEGSLTINDGEPAVGRAAITEAVRSFMVAFPDLQVKMDELSIDDGIVGYHWTLSGANTGPGGKGHQVQISGLEEWTFGDEGLIAESQGHYDAADFERQVEGIE